MDRDQILREKIEKAMRACGENPISKRAEEELVEKLRKKKKKYEKENRMHFSESRNLNKSDWRKF